MIKMGANMFIIKKLKKLFAYLIICTAIFFGFLIADVAEWKEHPIISILIYCIFGLFPFLLGFLLLKGKQPLREDFWMRIRSYSVLTLILPVIVKVANYQINLKEMRVSNPKDVYLDSASTLGVLIIPVGFVALFSFLAIYISWFKISKYVFLVFMISIVLCMLIPFLTKDDYRAIRDEGIIISKKGEEQLIQWSDIQEVALNGFIPRVKLNKKINSNYNWNFIFYLKDGEKITFGPFGYHSYALESSLAIKNKTMQEKIPIAIDILSEKELEYAQIDIKYEDGNPDDFYSLFQYDTIRKEHYNIPYK